MNRIIAKASKFWWDNSQRKALNLVKKHNLQVIINQTEFEEQFNAISYLIDKGKVNLLKSFVKDTELLTRKSITYLSTNKNIKHALELFQSSNLKAEDFPEMLHTLKSIEIQDMIANKKISLYNLIDICKDDVADLAIITNELSCHSLKKDKKWMMELVRGINLKYQNVVPNASVGPSRPIENPYDEFGPFQDECLKLDKKVVFVGSEEELDKIELEGEVAGLDCEWKPSFVRYLKPQVSIFQIAFPHVVYLLDFLNLYQSSLFQAKINSFMNSDIPKLGVSFDGDMKRLKKSLPDIASPNNMMDIVKIYQNLYNKNPGGLKGLCEATLGKSLCKNQQVSNWNNRPLRQSQLHYAAIDAYIQIPIWKSFGNIDFEIDNSLKYPPPVKCKKCGSRQHENCDIGVKCSICHRFGHKSSQCPKQK